MMNIVITGSSHGIGLATAERFLAEGHIVHGIDVEYSGVDVVKWSKQYTHHMVDVRNINYLPDIKDVDILINNAGVQNSGDDIGINLKGLINCTEKYGLHPHIKSIVNLASVSAHNGAEFGEYTASKGGVLSYTIWTAKQVAKWGATCNSLSFGGVLTEMNDAIINDKLLWNQVMYETPLKRWCSAEEAAQWIYFVSVMNKSMSGQDIIIDNLEMFNHRFIWPE